MGFDRDYTEQDITFQDGLVEFVENSMVPPGAAVRLRNWQADPTGGLRVREGWKATARTGLPAGALRGRGIGHFVNPTSSYNTPTLRNTDTNSTSSGTGLTVTMSPTSVTGNCLVATLLLESSSASIVVPTDFVLAHTSPDGFNRIYVAQNCPAKTSVVFTWSATQAAVLAVAEYTNVNTTSALDVIANNSGTSTTVDSGTTATTTTTYDVATAILKSASGGDTPQTPNNGFSSIMSGAGAGGGFRVVYKVMSAAGAANVQSNTSGSGAWQGVIITLKAKNSDTPVTNNGHYMVAHADTVGGDYELYNVNRDNLETATWALADTITASSPADPVAFTMGLSKLLYTSVKFSTARQWDPNVGAGSIASGPAGRCIAFHKSRVFIGGTIASPSLLHWSDVGSTSFTAGTAGTIYVGRDDGEAIEEIIPTETGLLIGKENSLWVLTGSGHDNFQMVQLSDGGAAPGRSMERTPYGTVVAGKEYVYLVTGGTVETISEAIESSYGMTGSWMSTSYRNGRLSVLDAGSGTIWVYDFRRNIWTGDERVATTDEQPVFLFEQGSKHLFAPRAATSNGLLGWHSIPGGDRVRDFSPLSETFEAWTPEMWLTGPEKKFTPRYLHLKLRQRVAGVGDTGLTITPVLNGTAGTALVVAARATTGAFWKRFSIGQGRGIDWMQLKFSQTATSSDDAVFDIERAVIGYNVEEVR